MLLFLKENCLICSSPCSSSMLSLPQMFHQMHIDSVVCNVFQFLTGRDYSSAAIICEFWLHCAYDPRPGLHKESVLLKM